jgi:hypothetical protein
VSRLRIPQLLFFLILYFSISFSQKFLNEMELKDISNTQEVKSIIIREQDQALLVVKSQIPDLHFLSNYFIYRLEEKEPGKWYIFLAPGTHRMSFQAEGFISAQTRFYFKPKEVKGIRIDIIPAEKTEEKNKAIVVIKTDPDKAKVYIDEQFYGETPYLGKLIPGQYKLKLTRDKHHKYEETIVLVQGETLPVSVDLKPLIGFLTLTSHPTAATVIIDSLELGKTPFRGRLPIGPHKLELKKDNYLSHFEAFTITEGKTHVLNIALKEVPSKDIAPKLRLTEKSPKSKSKKWLYIGGGAAVLVGAAAVLILSGSGGGEQSPPQNQSLPEPPSFP